MSMKDKIKEKIVETLKDTIMGKNSQSGSQRASLAENIIRNHTIWSMGAGLIPVLIADIFAVSALQLDMIRQLCKVYEIDYEETRGKAIVTSLTSSTLARLGARSIVKLIPGIGSIIGGVTVSMFAGASTYALGEVFKKHFESGGTILDFDPDRVKNAYKEKFEKGKEQAKEWSREKMDDMKESASIVIDDIKDSAAVVVDDIIEIEDEQLIKEDKVTNSAQAVSDNIDPIAKLKELGELKASGVLTDEEFQKMKKKLIDDF